MLDQANVEIEHAVLDTSVVINLIHSKNVELILRNSRRECVVTDQVVYEIDRGRVQGRHEPKILQYLIDNGMLINCSLNKKETDIFLHLTSLEDGMSIGDGEASTIAMAHQRGWIAYIDDKKATKVCAESYPFISLSTSVNFFLEVELEPPFDKELLRDSICNALKGSRMFVPDQHIDEIISLIGRDRARDCPSIPQSHMYLGDTR